MYLEDLVYRPGQDTGSYEVMPYRPETDTSVVEVLPYAPTPRGAKEVAEDFLRMYLDEYGSTAGYIPWAGSDPVGEKNPAAVQQLREYIKTPVMQEQYRKIREKYPFLLKGV